MVLGVQGLAELGDELIGVGEDAVVVAGEVHHRVVAAPLA
jgi:hypothetical protein